METITLTRRKINGKAVFGTMVMPIEDKDGYIRPYSATTLENADYLIPAGTYPLRLTWSPRFKKLMPLIDEVPDREGIRIHMGTKPEHSTGCVLVSYLALENLKILFNQRKKWYEEDEMRIRISDGLEESPH